MPSPYRESDNTPPAPLEELEWRRQVARSAFWAQLLAVGEMALLGVTRWLPARFALSGAVAWWVMGAAIAVATWMYTARRPRDRVGWRGWLLRASVPVCLGVTGLLLLGMHVELASYILGVPLLVASVAWTWPRRRRWSRGLMMSGLDWMLFLLGLGMIVLPSMLDPLWRGVGMCFVVSAAAAASSLRRALLTVEVQWWFDNQTATPGEWAALLVYRNGLAQVLFMDERPGWFQTQNDATIWLLQNGYLIAERALAEHLVDGVPPDVLPMPRRRKRLRAAATPQEPRLRVASEGMADEVADEASDELDDSMPLDEPEPPRAVAADDPHDPRA